MRLLWVTILLLAACSSGGGDLESFCADLAGLDQLDQVLSEVDRTDPAAVDDALGRYVESLSELTSDAPGSIRSDVETIRDYARALSEAAADETDPIVDAGALTEAASRFPGIDAATARLASFADSECGLDLGQRHRPRS